MSLDLNADITKLRGAEYNPRMIDEKDLAILARSIEQLGLVKPLIVRNDLLVAGHQRTKALRRLGITTAPVFRLGRDTTLYDEVRFNQLHNGTDMDCGDEEAHIPGGFDKPGWHIVPYTKIKANFRGRLANVRQQICEMVGRYGPWGGVVATLDGKIMHAAQYAISARLTGTPLTVYVLPPDKVELAFDLLGRQYGVFHYDRLERQTYVQTLAQPNRIRAGNGAETAQSVLYDSMVLPFIAKNPGRRWVDFGAGKGEMAMAMRGRGHNFHDVELFRRDRRLGLDERAIHRMINRLCLDMTKYGPYDNLVCDSVINSVDTREAETAVMTMCNLLVKKGNHAFISGRRLELPKGWDNATRVTKKKSSRMIEFLDKDGFTAMMREGKWFYQKYHSDAEVPGLFERFGFKVLKHAHGSAWQVTAIKERELPEEQILAAIDLEFNMPLSDTKRIGRNQDVRNAYFALKEIVNGGAASEAAMAAAEKANEAAEAAIVDAEPEPEEAIVIDEEEADAAE